MTLHAAPCALIAIVLWSSNAVVAKFALTGLSVEQVQFLQFSGASLVFFLASRRDQRFRAAKLNAPAIILGLTGLVGAMVFQYLAFAFGPIAQVNLIAYSWPLLCAVIVIGLGTSASPFRLLLTSVLGFIGVALLITEGSWAPWRAPWSWGMVTALLSALCMAVYTVGVGRLSVSPAALLLPASLAGVAGSGVWVLVAANPPPDLMMILFGLYLGVGPMGVGYLCWSRALRLSHAGRIAVLGYATPVLSTAWLIFSGEGLTLMMTAGGTLIVISCALIGGGLPQPSTALRQPTH